MYELSSFIGFVASLAAIIAVGAAIFFAARSCLNWVLGPLDRAAKNRQFPIQFGLADLLCLFVLIQLSIGFMHWTLENVEAVVVLDILLGVVVIAVWWKSVRTLSQAGIHGAWRRCFVLVVSLPGAYVSSVALIALPFVAAGCFADQQPAAAVWLLVVEIILPFVLYGLSRFTKAIVASSENVVIATLVENTRPPTASAEQ